MRVSTESWPWIRKFSRRSSRDSNPRPFNHESGALTTELSPPQYSGPLSNAPITLNSSYNPVVDFFKTVTSLLFDEYNNNDGQYPESLPFKTTQNETRQQQRTLMWSLMVKKQRNKKTEYKCEMFPCGTIEKRRQMLSALFRFDSIVPYTFSK